MALYLSKSRKILPHLKPKMSFLGKINLSSWNSCFSQNQAFLSTNGRNPHPFLCNRPALFTSRRFDSAKADKHLGSLHNGGDPQALNFPGGIVKFTPEMKFLSEVPEERIHCYRVLDDSGQLVSKNFVQVDKDIALKMYRDMVTLQTMDTIFYEAQRQGRISFYVTAIGEEAINIASAAALSMDDLVFPQYREAGVLLWRGFTLQEFANQCFGNKNDNGKGRQMPAHYGSNKHNYFTIASTVATQIPHAVGAAYSLKMDGRDACTVTYFGDGGTSTGDFHAAINFAAVMEAPVILFCRNNGWAISTPISDQFRSDGIVVRGQAYGVRSIRVDGNDTLAVFSAVHVARKMAICESRPVLIEALTYRAGHHTTSDDSSRYRSIEEIEWWRVAQDPVARFRKWLEGEGWWTSLDETDIRNHARQEVLLAIQVAEKVEKPTLKEIFTDVYDSPPSNLCDQEESLREMVKRHPQDYPSYFSS
ncbi:Branched chain alpha-keto acid dehydrogenase complex, alpha subunit [Handroanthus impetiginosus]|uniref:3-methyl-2-oxobutanoate dehydrogenase (2-methylpropanoyl-transferring) n=1 Tax=Handroanthus impetiginosus TaxID=429701 RepID=A0A2G9FZ10_9LAMI|nr:Branched chain alpha-keto acid dehydrogenase complex, alpha subunit [Handroanthus impetiginosus]